MVELNRGQMAAARTAMRRTLLLHPTAAVAAINLFTLSDGAVSPANLLAILRRARCTVPVSPCPLQPRQIPRSGAWRDDGGGKRLPPHAAARAGLSAGANQHSSPLSKGEQWATSLLWPVAVRLMPGEPLAHQALAVALKGSDRLIEAKRAYQVGGAGAEPATFGITSAIWRRPAAATSGAIHLYRRAVMILPRTPVSLEFGACSIADRRFRQWLGVL